MRMSKEEEGLYWFYFREERDRLERIDRILAAGRGVGLSFGEISEVLGIPYESVRTIYRRALRKMRSRVVYLRGIGRWGGGVDGA